MIPFPLTFRARGQRESGNRTRIMIVTVGTERTSVARYKNKAALGPPTIRIKKMITGKAYVMKRRKLATLFRNATAELFMVIAKCLDGSLMATLELREFVGASIKIPGTGPITGPISFSTARNYAKPPEAPSGIEWDRPVSNR